MDGSVDGSSAGTLTRVERERGERIGGIKQTYKEELMRIRAYGWQSALPCQVAPLE